MDGVRAHALLTGTLAAAIAAAMPALVVGTALWVAVNPWLVEFQYALPGFPDDGYGLDGEERAGLAVSGLRSIRPLDDGTGLLREARLPDGTAAFTEREISHMDDVRGVVSGFVAAWAVALAVLVVAAVALVRVGATGAVLRGVGRGGVLTLGLFALVGVGALVDFDGFFTAFHGVFFEADTWRFERTDTLLRLYPETFWVVATGVMVALVVGQSVAMVLLSRRRRGAGRERQPLSGGVASSP